MARPPSAVVPRKVPAPPAWLAMPGIALALGWPAVLRAAQGTWGIWGCLPLALAPGLIFAASIGVPSSRRGLRRVLSPLLYSLGVAAVATAVGITVVELFDSLRGG